MLSYKESERLISKEWKKEKNKKEKGQTWKKKTTQNLRLLSLSRHDK